MRRLDLFENERLIRAGYLLSVVGFNGYALASSIFTSSQGCSLLLAPGLFSMWAQPRRVVELNPDKATEQVWSTQ